MIRYRYADEFVPPAPFVNVTLGNPELIATTDLIAAQIDTGADRSVIPRPFVDQLQLKPVREIPIAGFGGTVER